MPEAAFYQWWTIGGVLGAVVVLIVAALLVAILLVARSIARLGAEALDVAGGIIVATDPIWSLETANTVVTEIAAAADSIDEHVNAIADTLAPDREGGEPVDDPGR